MNKKFKMVAICSIAGILLICGCMQTSKNTKDSQKGSELEAVDTMHILQVGEKVCRWSLCAARLLESPLWCVPTV